MTMTSKMAPWLFALCAVGVACSTSDPAPRAEATAEGVAGNGTDGTDESGGATEGDDATTPTSEPSADDSVPDTVAEPSVTVPPDTMVSASPTPALQRIEPIVVPVVFEGQPLVEVTPEVVPGAGIIEQLGDSDVYTVEMVKGQTFILEQLGGCSFDGDDDFMAGDVRGAGNNSGVIFLDGDCDAIIRFDADVSETVEITVEKAANDAIGTYSFRIVDVTDPEPIALESGDIVFPNDPEGSGWIEGFGHQDIFTFQATKDRPFIIRQLGGCAFDGGDDFMAADVRGAGINSGVIFLDGDCDSIDRYEPDTTDTVEIIVQNSGDDVFGFYSFQIYEVVSTDQEAEDTLTRLGAVERDDGTVISLDETVLFDFGETTLRRDADQALVQLAELLRYGGQGSATVVGHTDSVGTAEDNQRLSQQRADAVLARLVELGVATGTLTAEGRGELEPLADNVAADGSDNPEGRALNRRVEVIVGLVR